MNPARFLLGPAPLPSTLRQLGLHVAIDPGLPAAQTCSEAVNWLAQWRQRCERAIETAIEGGNPGASRAERLLQEIRRAGERAWLGHVFNALVSVGGVSDLVAWCHLQMAAIAAASAALPVVFVSRRQVTLEDRQLLDVASSVLALGPAGDVPNDFTFISVDDWSDYSQEVDFLEQSQIPPPRALAATEVGSVVAHAYAYFATVKDTPLVSRPTRPEGLQTVAEWTAALGALLSWCRPFDGKPDTDGPREPETFVFGGEAYHGFSPSELRLLTILHEQRDKASGISYVPLDYLLDHLDTGRVRTIPAIEKVKSRLSNKFSTNRFPAEVEIRAGCVYAKFWHQPPSTPEL